MHCSRARRGGRNNHCQNWIRSLLRVGLCPEIETLAITPYEQWRYWEKRFIERFLQLGCRLVNGDEGGGGAHRTGSKGHIRVTRGSISKWKRQKHKPWEKVSDRYRRTRLRKFLWFMRRPIKRGAGFKQWTEISLRVKRNRLRKFRNFFSA